MRCARCLAVIALLYAGQVAAESLDIDGSAYSGPFDNLGGQLPIPDTEFINQTSASGPLYGLAEVPYAACCGSTIGRALANADYGWLRAEALVFITGFDGPPYPPALSGYTFAAAAWIDTLTFHQPSGQVGNGSATIQVRITGSLSASDGGAVLPQGARARFDVRFRQFVAANGGVVLSQLLSKSGEIATHFLDPNDLLPPPDTLGTFQFDISFFFEQPVHLGSDITVWAQGEGGLDPLAASEGIADFLSTASWDGVVEVRDFQGQSIPFTVTSQSGADYAGPLEPPPPPPIFEDGFEALPW